MRIRLFIVLTGATVLFAGAPARAHHGFAAEFDINKPVELKGTVVQWELINPHSWIHLEVKDAGGTVARWAVETAPPNNLFRLGFTRDSLPVGTELVIKAYRAKDGSLRASGKDITFTDGRKLLLGLQPTTPAAPQ